MGPSARGPSIWGSAPTLAGATTRGRVVACLGAFVGIAVAGLLATLVHGQGVAALPWLVTSMGSSAMLLFVLPASPMAQPWPIVAGNTLSAFIGFALGRWLGHDVLVCGLAVALAIGAMSLTRSLHPPAAGTALTGVLGGSLISPADWWFPLSPVAIDAVALVAVGLIFHHLLGHPYPHRRKRRAWVLDAAATVHDDLSEKDLDAVLARLGQTYDIEREDLRMLLQELERRGRDRRRSYNGQCNVGTVRIGDEVR